MPASTSCCACSPCAASRVWRSMAVATNSHRNYIAGEWVDSESGEQFENHNPGHGRAHGLLPALDGGRCRPSRRRRPRGLRELAPAPGPEACRDPLPGGRAPARPQARAVPADDPGDGQGAGRGRRGRAGGHRHDLLHGRRGPAHVRSDGARRDARQVCDERAPAHGRRRGDHAVQLPDGDPHMEADAGARDRQHGRVQAGSRHAAPGRDAGRDLRGGGAAQGRAQHRPRRRRRPSASA